MATSSIEGLELEAGRALAALIGDVERLTSMSAGGRVDEALSSALRAQLLAQRLIARLALALEVSSNARERFLLPTSSNSRSIRASQVFLKPATRLITLRGCSPLTHKRVKMRRSRGRTARSSRTCDHGSQE
jgi:hypothetical protein